MTRAPPLDPSREFDRFLNDALRNGVHLSVGERVDLTGFISAMKRVEPRPLCVVAAATEQHLAEGIITPTALAERLVALPDIGDWVYDAHQDVWRKR